MYFDDISKIILETKEIYQSIIEKIIIMIA